MHQLQVVWRALIQERLKLRLYFLVQLCDGMAPPRALMRVSVPVISPDAIKILWTWFPRHHLLGEFNPQLLKHDFHCLFRILNQPVTIYDDNILKLVHDIREEVKANFVHRERVLLRVATLCKWW